MLDETGWRQNGRKAWLWTFVGKLGTLFSVRPSRARKELHALLGEDFRQRIDAVDNPLANLLEREV